MCALLVIVACICNENILLCCVMVGFEGSMAELMALDTENELFLVHGQVVRGEFTLSHLLGTRLKFEHETVLLAVTC